jgi:hypothetical protein
MTLKKIIPLALALMTALPVFSQVQLFEAEVSGIVPYVTGKWNQGIQEWTVGGEYNIDGRTTLGFAYSRPIKDTLSFDSKLHSFTINPYAIFEFIEPDNLKTFSFALRTDLISEDASRSSTSDTLDVTRFNAFSRTSIGGGPIFALRIFSSDRLALIPTAAYEFFYVTYKRDAVTAAGVAGKFPKGKKLWHDLSGSCPFHFILNEFNGITVEPKVTFKFGPGHAAEDLINVSATVGYIRSF